MNDFLLRIFTRHEYLKVKREYMELVVEEEEEYRKLSELIVKVFSIATFDTEQRGN